MKSRTMCIFALAALLGGVLLAQDHDITGTWQGTLHADKDLRIVMKVSKADTGGLKAVMYSIDQGGQPRPGSITVQGSTVKFAVAAIGGTYEGKLASADGTSIAGVWTQGQTPLPLDLTLANDKTEWTIPEPPPPPKQMAADANPSFEVATIKPSKEGTPFTIHPTASGTLIANNASLGYLIKFAYEVHPRQITKEPAWLETDKYDVTAKPDKEGMPSLRQMRIMVRKLLADSSSSSIWRKKNFRCTRSQWQRRAQNFRGTKVTRTACQDPVAGQRKRESSTRPSWSLSAAF